MTHMRLRGTPASWIAALTGRSDKAWKHATMMMGGLETEHGVSPQPFIDALDSGSAEVTFWSIIALDRLRARAAVPKLCGLCRHKKINVRESAVSALAKIAPGDPAVKAAVFGAFRDRSPLVRSEAVRAVMDLRKLDGADFRRVRTMLRDSNSDVRYSASITIDNIKRRKTIASDLLGRR